MPSGFLFGAIVVLMVFAGSTSAQNFPSTGTCVAYFYCNKNNKPAFDIKQLGNNVPTGCQFECSAVKNLKPRSEVLLCKADYPACKFISGDEKEGPILDGVCPGADFGNGLKCMKIEPANTPEPKTDPPKKEEGDGNGAGHMVEMKMLMPIIVALGGFLLAHFIVK